jgi:hypothetical protein
MLFKPLQASFVIKPHIDSKATIQAHHVYDALLHITNCMHIINIPHII